jgi:hypothetical protein
MLTHEKLNETSHDAKDKHAAQEEEEVFFLR